MAAVIGIVVLLILVGIFYLVRSMGMMGQQPSARERARHNATDPHGPGPRAPGLD